MRLASLLLILVRFMIGVVGGRSWLAALFVSAVVVAGAPPVVSLSVQGTNFATPWGTTITTWVTGSATSGTSSIATLQLLDGGAVLSTVSASSLNVPVQLGVGNHGLTLKATDQTGLVTTSSIVNVNVTSDNSAVDIALLGNANTFYAPPGGRATIPVQITGCIQQCGVAYIYIYDGSNALTDVETNAITWTGYNGTAQVSLPVGTHYLTATTLGGGGQQIGSTQGWFAVTVQTDTMSTPTLAVGGNTYTAPTNGVAAVQVSGSVATSASPITQLVLLDGGQSILTVNGSSLNASVNLAAGTHSLQLRATDSGGLTSTSSATSVSVITDNPPTPTLSLSATSYFAPQGATISVPINASATGHPGSIARIDLLDGGTQIATVNAGSLSTTMPLSIGTHSLQVRATDAYGIVGVSTAQSVNVALDTLPTVNLTVPSVNFVAAAGGTAPVSVSAAGVAGTNPINGLVLLDGSNVIYSTGAASFSTSVPLAIGTHALQVRASDAPGYSSLSQAVTVTVAQDAPPTLTLNLASNQFYVSGSSGTVSLSATATAGNAPITQFSLSDATTHTVLATTTGAPISVNATLATGTHGLQLSATDSLGVITTSPITSINVSSDVLPTISGFSVAANPSVFIQPGTSTSIAVSGSATAGSTPIAKLDVINANTQQVLYTTTASSFSTNITLPGGATYLLALRVTDAVGGVATQDALAFTVYYDIPPVVTLTVPNPNTSAVKTVGVAVPVSGTASEPSANGTGIAVTQLVLLDGSNVIATSTYSAGQNPAQFNASPNLDVGTHILTLRATDSDGDTSLSAPVTVTVAPIADNPPVPTISVQGINFATPNGTTITTWVTGSATSSSSTIASMQLLDGAMLLSTVNGSALNMPVQLAIGPHNLAIKAIDQLGLGATSTPVTVNVASSNTGVDLAVMGSTALVARPGTTVNIPLQISGCVTQCNVAYVYFYDNGATFADLPTNAINFTGYNGTTQLALGVGTHSLTAATLTGSGAAVGSTSGAISVTVAADNLGTPTLNVATSTYTVPTGGTASVSVSGSASAGNYPVTSLALLDGGKVISTVNASSLSTSVNLAAGTHSLQLQATDTAGLTSLSTTSTVTVVTDDPPVSTLNLAATNYFTPIGTTVTVPISASASSRASTISRLDLLDGGTQIATVNSGTMSTNVQLAIGSHALQLRATDAYGVVGLNTTQNVNVVGDNPPAATLLVPTTSFSAPAGGTASVAVTGSGTAGSNAVSKLELLDAGTVIYATNSSSFNTNVTLGLGTHTLQVRATDTLGDTGLSSVSTVSITAPTNAAPVATLNVQSTTITLDGFTTGACASDWVSGSGVGGQGTIAKLELLVNGSVVYTSTQANFSTSVCLNTSSVLQLRATDSTGQSALSSSVGVSVNTMTRAPTLTVEGNANAFVALPGGTATVPLTISGCVFNCGVQLLKIFDGSSDIQDIQGNAGNYTGYTGNTQVVLGVGTHVLTLTTYTGAGTIVGTSTPVTVIVTADTPPTANLTLPTASFIAPAGGTASVMVQGSSIAGTNPVTQLQLMDGKQTIATVNATSMSTSVPLAVGTHSLQLVASDALGVTGSSTSVAVTVTADGTPTAALTVPTTNYLAPAGMNASVAFSGTGTGNGENVVKLDLLDGTTQIATVNAATIANAVPLAIGAHTLQLRATDTLGTVGYSAPVSVTVGTDAPPTAALSVKTTSYIVPTGSNAAVDVTSTATVGDGSVPQLTLLDGATVVATGTGANWEKTASLGAGTHTLQVRVTDALGLTALSAPVTVTITADTPAATTLNVPTTSYTILQGANASVPYTVSATAGSATMTRLGLLDGTTVLNTTTGNSLSGNLSLSAGSHVLTAQATDVNGIVGTSTPVTVSVMTDIAPTATLALADGNTTGSYTISSGNTVAVPVTATAAAIYVPFSQIVLLDNGSVIFNYTGNVATKLGLSNGFGYSANLPAGTHQLQVQATDTLGMVGQSPVLSVTVLPGAPPSATLIVPTTTFQVASGDSASVPFQITSQAGGGTVKAVALSIDGQPTQYQANATSLGGSAAIPTGTHTLTATATDDKGMIGTSLPVSVKITAIPPSKEGGGTTNSGPQFTSVVVPGMSGSTGTGNIALPAANATFSATLNLNGTTVSQVAFHFVTPTNVDGQVGDTMTVPLSVSNGVAVYSTTVALPVNLPVGQYQVYAVATYNNGTLAQSALTPVNVTWPFAGTTLRGGVGGVVQGQGQDPYLQGWACDTAGQGTLGMQTNVAVYVGSATGTPLVPLFAANTIPVDASQYQDNYNAQQVCGDGKPHLFRIGLSQYNTQYANQPLVVQALPATGTTGEGSIPLPCSSCYMPGTLNITLVTPTINESYIAPANIFMGALVQGVPAGQTVSSVTMFVNGESVPANSDSSIGVAGVAGYSALLPNVSNTSSQAEQLPLIAEVTLSDGEVVTSPVVMVNLLPGTTGGSGSVNLAWQPLTGLQAGTSANLQVTATCGGTCAIAKMQFLLGNNAFPTDPVIVSGAGTNTVVYGLSEQNIPAGTYDLIANALDAKGEVLATVRQTVTVAYPTTLPNPVTIPTATAMGALLPAQLNSTLQLPCKEDIFSAPCNFAAGTLPGNFQVTPNGAATYAIPIDVPTSSGGVKPSFSLGYNSQGGYGPIGMGWSLSGQSVITRCPQTLQFDGVLGVVDFNLKSDGTPDSNNDRYCLDGQRLIAINGVDGANGTEYRTANESFSKIISYGTTGHGPSAFRVWTKSGQIIDYGTTDDSRVPLPSPVQPMSSVLGSAISTTPAPFTPAAPGKLNGGTTCNLTTATGCSAAGTGQLIASLYTAPTISAGSTSGWAFANSGEVMAWAQAAVSDVAGNTINYSYEQIPTTGEYYLKQVDYASNPSQNVAASSHVIFSYGNRTDKFLTYLAGARIYSTQLLTGIQVQQGASTLRNYQLSYYPSSYTSTQRQLLQSVQECGSDGNCLNPTVFNWNTSTTQQQSSLYYSVNGAVQGPSVAANQLQVADVNGDGFDDLITAMPASGTKYPLYVQACINQPSTTGSNFACAAPSFAATTLKTASVVTSDWIFVGDFDGDGRVDIATYDGTEFGQWHVCYNKQGVTGDQCQTWANAPHAWGDDPLLYPFHNYVAVGNFDGSGQSSLLAYHYPSSNSTTDTPTAGWWVYSPTKGNVRLTDPILTGNGFNPTVSKLFVADFDGDGRTDFLIGNFGLNSANQYATTWTLCLARSGTAMFTCSDVSSSFELINPTNQASDGSGVVIGDFNGDGKADVIFNEGPSTSGGNKFRVYYFDGVGFDQGPELIANKASASNTITSNALGSGLGAMLSSESGNWNVCSGFDVANVTCNDISFDATGSIVAPAFANNVFGDFDGRGKLGILSQNTNSGSWTLLEDMPGFTGAQTELTDVLQEITNGIGAQTAITYGLLTDATVYTAGTADLPKINMIGPMAVVHKVQASDGFIANFNQSEMAETDYTYAALRSDPVLGMLGFGSVKMADLNSGVTVTTAYSQDWPYIGMPVTRTTTNAKGKASKVESYTLNWAAGSPSRAYPGYSTAFAYACSATTSLNDPDTGALLSQTTTTMTYDPTLASPCNGGQSSNGSANYGNVSNLSIKTTDASLTAEVYTKTTTNTYSDDVTHWQLGRLATTTVLHQMTQPNNPLAKASTCANGFTDCKTRTASFSYYPNGLLQAEQEEPDQAQFNKTTTYGYDVFGNKTSVAVSTTAPTGSAGWFATRTSRSGYDANGVFPLITQNALSQSETYLYDSLGRSLSLTGPNGLTTSWTYDGFGRKTQETRADGTVTLTRYNFCGTKSTILATNCLQAYPLGHTYPAYYVASITTGGSPILTYYDNLGRKWRSDTFSFDGTQRVLVDTLYNQQGLVAGTTRPYFVAMDGSTTSVTPTFDTTTYDSLNRPYQIIRLESGGVHSTTTLSYSGLTTTTTNQLGQSSVETKWANGKTRSVTDNLSQTTNYYYDAVNNLTKVQLPDGSSETTTFDAIGRYKTGLTTPDSGAWSYSYDALGELVSQTSPNDATLTQTQTMAYDTLGRITSRVTRDSTSKWMYDNCSGSVSTPAGLSSGTAIGKLCLATGDNQYSRALFYDQWGRLAGAQTTIDRPYTVYNEYDAASRIVAVDYPDGAHPGQANGIRVAHYYNAQGALAQVWSTQTSNIQNNQLIWMATSVDAEGRVLGEMYGNNVATTTGYDPDSDRLATISAGVGNAAPVVSEAYLFDSIGRLSTKTDSFGENVTYGYDNLNRLNSASWGNVTQSLNYANNGNILCKSDVVGAACTATATPYTYTNSAHPHAVTAISGTVNGVQNPQFHYDNDGNMLDGAGRSYQWTSFDQPSVAKGNGHTVNYLYDVDRLRVMETDASSAGTVTTVSINPRLDLGHGYQVIKANGTNTDKVYVSVNGRSIASIQNVEGQTAPTYEWYHFDSLGSIVAVSDQSGNAQARYIYDPWGVRVQSVTGVNERRGYTGHEEIDSLSLVNMNGRLFDPQLGRVLSVDPVIQAPLNAQNYNQYSYVLNNPLNFTDPSGYSFWTDIRGVGEMIAIDYLVGPEGAAGVTGVTGSAAASAALAGALAGGIQRGSWQGALQGAVFAELNYGIGNAAASGAISTDEAVVDHALLGGVQSRVAGGSFSAGFMSAGLSSLAAPVIDEIPGNGFAGFAARVGSAAILGGTASVLDGGKFANGAIVAAFERAFNAESQLGGRAVARWVAGLRQEIADNAVSDVGSEDWAKDSDAQGPAGVWKCSTFVGDEISDVLGGAPSYSRFSWSRFTSVSGYWQAGMWADTSLDPSGAKYGWAVTRSPVPGDTFSYKENDWDATGHVGIYVGNGNGVWAGEYTVNTGSIAKTFPNHDIVYRHFVGF